MKSNQSVHITIKQPPDPNPVRTLGIFDDPDNPNLPQIIQSFLSNTFIPKDEDFKTNVKDEVLKLLTTSSVIAVSRQGPITTVYLK